MKITVVGSGYVGLVTAACFADLGNDVVAVDSDIRKIRLLKKGICHFYEPGLDELVRRYAAKKRLTFATDVRAAAQKSEVIFIAVGTPPRPDGSADLSSIEEVAREVASVLGSQPKLIIEKSTVPVRTALRIKEVISGSAKPGSQFDIASNPEFLREGSAIHDFMHPDRIVVGADSARAREVLKKLYSSIKAPLVLTDLNSAEIIKHASNSFLAMKISFINAVSRVCELSGANIEEVANGMGLDSRIGSKFLNAGIGFGGFCFPKDLSAFVHISESLGYDFKLLKEVQNINSGQIAHFLKKAEDKLWNIRGKKIGVWGLAFKANTDDMRFAPSIEILRHLTDRGAQVSAYDPKAAEKAREIFPSIRYARNAYEAVRGRECLLILTEWNEFKEVDLKKVKKLMRRPLIVDGRNLYDPAAMKRLGFEYLSMGRA